MRPVNLLTLCAIPSLVFACSLQTQPIKTAEPVAIEGEQPQSNDDYHVISRKAYQNQMYGFWLGQCIANWTGLVTEMDKIGGEGPHGQFYTRDDWGKPDQPSIWGQGLPSHLSDKIDFVFKDAGEVWGSDDDTDIEYIYQHLIHTNGTTMLTGEQIREGWLTHIYSEENTPFGLDENGKPITYIWQSNKRAHELMAKGMVPPLTSDPKHNEKYEMIDAQLTTEIFGFFAPARPDVALKMARLPIQTTARKNAELISEFYVLMYSLASSVDKNMSMKDQIHWMADSARAYMPSHAYPAKMFDYVKKRYQEGAQWETVRDELYQRYQVEQKDGYDITAQNLYCNGCFAAGINFAASIVSLLYGEGDIVETIKIAALSGWDSDNPAATWGGLLGFMIGKDGVEKAFNRTFADKFNIHRTRGNFPNNGMDNFTDMAKRGVEIVDRVVAQHMGGTVDVDGDYWYIPKAEFNVVKLMD